MSTQGRFKYVRKTWGDEVWTRTVGIFSQSPDVVSHVYGLGDLAHMISKSNSIVQGLQPQARGEAYIAWLAREISKIIKPAFKTHRRWAAEDTPYNSTAAVMAFQSANVRIDSLYRLWPSIRDWFEHARPDVTPMGYSDAAEAAYRWHQNLKTAERHADPATVLHTWPDGVTMQLLGTHKQLESEGKAMDHCVGGYWKDVREGTAAILSLRDKDSVPHATLEVRLDEERAGEARDPSRWLWFEQVQGIGNGEIEHVWRPYIVEFVRLSERRRGVPFVDSDLRGVIQLLPVAERLEKIWPAISVSLDRLYDWAENREISGVPWSACGLSGTIEPSSYEDDTVEWVRDELPDESYDLDEGRRDRIHDAIAYAVYNLSETMQDHAETTGKINNRIYSVVGARDFILSELKKDEPNHELIKGRITSILIDLNQLYAMQSAADDADLFLSVNEPEVYWTDTDQSPQDLDDIAEVLRMLMDP